MNCVIVGDVRQSLRDLRALGVQVQCCVTSPPYFGLRDYGHPGQIGLEKTPADYVAAMVEVFRLVRDVLADDGVLWLNLGDSYANTSASGPQGKKGQRASRTFTAENLGAGRNGLPPGLKPKDLIGIPWRVAFALQDDGWYLRQDIIWHKPNPMPESVRDRCTKAHEYVFMLTKKARYYWDAEAMKENSVCGVKSRVATRTPDGSMDERGVTRTSCAQRAGSPDGLRNRRSVWTLPPKPYKGAHFTASCRQTPWMTLTGAMTSIAGHTRRSWRLVKAVKVEMVLPRPMLAQTIANGLSSMNLAIFLW
jgi:hypothetical protein